MSSEFRVRIVSYSFASFAFFVFLYSFFSSEEVYKAQSIYWFYGSFISTLIPQIKQLKYSDLELIFREELKKTEANVEENIKEELKKTEASFEETLRKFEQAMKNGFAASVWLKARTKELVSSLDSSDYPEIENIEVFRDELVQYLEFLSNNLLRGIFGSPSKLGLNLHLKYPDTYIRALTAIQNQNELTEEKLDLDMAVREQLSRYMNQLILDIKSDQLTSEF